MTHSHPAYIAGFGTMSALIAQVGFEAARDQFNLDNPRNMTYSEGGLQYSRGERDALVAAIPEPVEKALLDRESADRIATLFNNIQTATTMLAVRDENGKRTYDFWLWHTDRCLATVALAEEFGIELPNLQTYRSYLADYPQNPKYAVEV